MSLLEYPPWVILHIPHDSRVIPGNVRSQFLLSDAELENELQLMTDHFTHTIFAEPFGAAKVVRSSVSRLVVDVERFAEDEQEPMAARGMGAVYEVTSQLKPLRRRLSPNERKVLMQTWYHPHHQRLEDAVADTLERYGRCLVIDGHSFPGTALPYEKADPAIARPDICIGSDPFHTPKALEQIFVEVFGRNGWRVAVNEPFAGALVPASRYKSDPRVMAVMVEVNRDLYLNSKSWEPNLDFARISNEIKACCVAGLSKFEAQMSDKPSARSSKSTSDGNDSVVTLRDVTVGGRIRKQFQSSVWTIAQKAASRQNESIVGNMLTSRQTTSLTFLDGEVSITRGEFGPSSGMFWDGILVKAFILYELGFDAERLLRQSLPSHKALKLSVREGHATLVK